MTGIRLAAGILVFILLIVASVSDIKTRKIPSYCSYPIMILAMVLFILDKEYLLIPLFILAVLGTGNTIFRIAYIVLSVVLVANRGEWLVPLIAGLVIGDIFFSMRLIGGGDAQLLFGMLTYAYRGWGMLIIIAAITIVSGFVLIIKNRGKAKNRILEILKNLKKGTIGKDTSRIQIPYAIVLCLSMAIYMVVQVL